MQNTRTDPNNGHAKNQWFGAVATAVEGWKRASLELAKIRALQNYIELIKSVRLAVLGFFVLLFLTGVSLLAVVMFHVGVFVLSPAGYKIHAIWGLFLFDLVFSGILYSFLFSQKRWMRYSQSSKWTEEVFEK